MSDPERPIARKRFGQNFLVDRTAVDRIVAALQVDSSTPVLEIGPGTGALTAPLIAGAGRIAAVEVDRDLASALRARFSEQELLLVQEDVLTVGLGGVLEELTAGRPGRLRVAGNLPYNLSKPIANKLIRERVFVERAVLMFQKEVALRLTATPGGKEYGPLSVLTALTFDVRRLFDLAPGAFRPRPKVTSSVTRWDRLREERLTDATETRLRKCLRVCFGSRRRTLRNNLRASFGSDADGLLDAAGLDGDARPERVEPEQFLALSAEPPWAGDGPDPPR